MPTTTTTLVALATATLKLRPSEQNKKEEEPYRYAHLLPYFSQDHYPPLTPFEHIDPGHRALSHSNPRAFLDNATVTELTPNLGTEVHGVNLATLSDEGRDQLALEVHWSSLPTLVSVSCKLSRSREGVLSYSEISMNSLIEDQSSIRLGEGISDGSTFTQLLGIPKVIQKFISCTGEYPPKKVSSPQLTLYCRDVNSTFNFEVDESITTTMWHSDVSYELQPPGLTTFFLLSQPETGGDTLFTSQVSTLRKLSPQFVAFLRTLKAVHSGVEQAEFSRSGRRGGIVRREPVENVHPVVRMHPVTGEEALYVNRQFTRRIVGLKREESETLLKFLFDHIDKSGDNQARVKWQPGTVVLWDNRITAHSAIVDYKDSRERRHGARITPQAERPDEPFHVLQAQAYCRGDFWTWDPKITTPPGLYIMSLLLKRVFMFKCTLPMFRLTTMLALLSLPPALTHLLCSHKRIRPPASLLSPTIESMILGAFPIAWFFGFLYYTEAPSLVFVVLTVVAASQDRHWLAALLGLISCTFRQTNVIWVLYAFASSQLTYLRFRRVVPGAAPPKKLHDPPALAAGPYDLFRSISSAPYIVVDILPSLIPYMLVLAVSGVFVIWNGGIVLGDKANHIPAFHVPQIYYFIAFSTAFGWPVLISGPGGPIGLAREVQRRMFGSREQTLLQTLILPVFIFPTLLPTPLLEPRYFLIPFILLRAQVTDVPGWALGLEGVWYASINAVTMGVFLYLPRGEIRFMCWPRFLFTPHLYAENDNNDYFTSTSPFYLLSTPMSKPPQSAAGGSPNKPSTRSSIRLSLGFASKALADVISKDTDKSARKAKENSSRRLSAIALKPAPRASMGDAKPSIQTIKRIDTPETKTVTRRRVSAGLGRASMDEQLSRTSETGVRTASLRPRTIGSSLPKYRPKSTIIQSTKSPSPTTGSRRPFSSSEDEKEDRPMDKVSSSEKASRPISPLPQRAALRSNVRTVNATPPPLTPSTISKPPATPNRISPTRPTKLAKVVTPTSTIASAIPRPTSATSSVSPTRTPKTPSARNTPVTRLGAQDKSSRASPSPRPSRNESSLARHSRTDSKRDSPTGADDLGNMSHISEGDSEDSEVENVALLLAPVASLTAPTPAMPRIQMTRTRKRLPPKTPRRASLLPTRANMSYLSPLPPDAEALSSALRPPQQGEKQGRGSILSWEQLASEASKTLGEDEIEHMLSDFPAPFQADAVSPTPSHSQLDIPESPCLSAMNSPGGYGSISQVLLPDVTPSPALHHQQVRFDLSPDTPTVDSATVTLLRLQLAAAENTAKERLAQMQAMEEEIHNLKQSRGREALHLSEQVAILEQQLKCNLEIRERADEERALYTRELEERLQQEQTLRDKVVKTAVVRGQELARAELDVALKPKCDSHALACSARIATSEWASVRDLAELELGVVRGEMQVLSLLLAELSQSTFKL
ncbi:hypothetical protein C0995_014145 [Termitomyces sp. Mi166|nr:hypothetical protein C0995_014145 [Termitomyces sp. Mi166\